MNVDDLLKTARIFSIAAINKKDLRALYNAVRRHITPEMIKPEYQGEDKYTGACYIASEAFYHLAGGNEAGLKPMNLKHEGISHWWIQDTNGNIYDLTTEQFESPVPYSLGRGRGFLTKNPSAPAQELIDSVLEEYN